MRSTVQLRRVFATTRRPRGVRARLVTLASGKVRRAGRETVKTNKAPTPLGSYSQGIKADKLVFVGGQLGIVPGTDQLISESPREQTEQAMKNMGAILEEAGTSFDKVVKTSLLLAEIEDYKEVNAAYAKYFTGDPPARVAYSVKGLPLNAKVEIDAIAMTE